MSIKEGKKESLAEASYAPAHLLLLLLDRMRGKPTTVSILVKQLRDWLTRRDGLLLKYADIDMIVEDEMGYLEQLHLAEKITLGDGDGFRITTLGKFVALGLEPQTVSRESSDAH